MTDLRLCRDCVQQKVPNPQPRYKATSYCLSHNSYRAQQSQKNNVLKKIIAAENWTRLQDKKTDGTYRFNSVELFELSKKYQKDAEGKAAIAKTVEDHDSPQFKIIAEDAEMLATIARCLLLRRALTVQERWSLIDELELGLESKLKYDPRFGDDEESAAVELDVEPASSGRGRRKGNEYEHVDPVTGRELEVDLRQETQMPGRPQR
jgi:hypothetical protein